jgi:uncharacterized protein with HEPN domain
MRIHHHYPKNTILPIRVLKAMRNFLVHAYHKIDIKIIWETIQYDIPEIKKSISELSKE